MTNASIINFILLVFSGYFVARTFVIHFYVIIVVCIVDDYFGVEKK